jgi:MOSC domain-containing protein YiiM
VPEEREVLDEGRLDTEVGLVGDGWSVRGSSKTADGGPNPEAQVTVTSARAAALVAGGPNPEAWAPAGDQLYVDLDLSLENLPPGSRIAVGEAVLEVSAEPHTGCGKYVRRFGVDAMKFVNSEVGRSLRLRGLNARVVTPGTVRRGDRVRKLS